MVRDIRRFEKSGVPLYMNMLVKTCGSFVLLFALMIICITWWCVVRFFNLKMRSQLTGKCFNGIFVVTSLGSRLIAKQINMVGN